MQSSLRLPLFLPCLLRRRLSLQLQSVNSTITTHLLLQQGIDHTVSRGLHFLLEGIGRYRHTSNC
jgi:hypothetical protein